jgi:hypothetical protein
MNKGKPVGKVTVSFHAAWGLESRSSRSPRSEVWGGTLMSLADLFRAAYRFGFQYKEGSFFCSLHPTFTHNLAVVSVGASVSLREGTSSISHPFLLMKWLIGLFMGTQTFCSPPGSVQRPALFPGLNYVPI